ncbi:MAG: creatininase family protein [Myxococcota bacterium]
MTETTPTSTTDHPLIRDWANLTGTDFAEMDRGRTIAMVSCSPLEVHGPHLPLQTDYREAEAISERTAERLAERFPDIAFVRLPPIYVATDVVPQPGSVMFRTSTLIRVLEDLGRSLAAQGFQHIWVNNFHGGPRHFVSIETACDRVSRRYGVTMISVFSLLLNRLTGGQSDLSKVFADVEGLDTRLLKGDTHAGAVETSLMLHILGRHVRPDYNTLERITVDLKLQRRGVALPPSDRRPTLVELLRSFPHKLKYFEEESYAGAPAIATPEIGAQMLNILAGLASDTLADVWLGRIPHTACHSPLWPLRWVFTNEAISHLFERWADYKTQVF